MKQLSTELTFTSHKITTHFKKHSYWNVW